jgi:hypothetical protein
MALSLVARLIDKLVHVQDNLVEENVDYLDMKAFKDHVEALYDAISSAIAEREQDEADAEDEDDEDEDSDGLETEG